MNKKFVVAQLGARMHYAVSKILDSAGLLDRLYTDGISRVWISRALDFFPKYIIPRIIRSAIGRLPRDLRSEMVYSFPIFGLIYSAKRLISRSSKQTYESYNWAGRKFGNLVNGIGFGEAGAIYGFNSASLEIMEDAKRCGLVSVLEQTIAPRSFELRLIEEEQIRWPGWEFQLLDSSCQQEEYISREEGEWKLADTIICGSNFVKNAVGMEGGPRGKCIVVPYGFAWNGKMRMATQGVYRSKKLNLLTVGTVGLRKGAPWLLDLAKMCNGRVNFRWVGPIAISSLGQAEVKKFIDLKGVVPRIDIDDHYEWADALVLLSVCEGSATVIYEALARGIPVICTENCGPPLGSGGGLFVIKARDSNAAYRVVKNFIQWKSEGRLPYVTERVRNFVSFEEYSRRLLDALGIPE